MFKIRFNKRSLKNYFLTRIPTNQKPNYHEFIRENLCVIRVHSCQNDFFRTLNKRGVVLFIVLGTLLVVVSLATVILSLILSHARLTHHQTSRIQAYYAALAGMNLARENLRNGTWTTGSYTLCNSGCTVNDSDIPYSAAINIEAPGTSIDGVGRKITITTTYTYTP